MTDLTRIDDGPVATVYSGHRAGVPVAVKVFPKRFDKRTMSSFAKEQAKLATVRRVTSILMVDGVEELPSGESALRMELCSQSLAALVERVGPLAAADVAVLGRAMASALAAAHGVGVVHGGVSPSNVLFRANGEPVVGDFGVTLRQAFTRDPLHAIEYLPPETLRTGTLDELTDLYGLGAVLHFALTGRSPHPGRLGEQPGERVLRILGEPVPAVNRGDVPVGLSTLVARLLATTPDRRPQKAAQVADRLTTMLPNPPAEPATEDWDDFDAPPPPPLPTTREDPLDFDDFAARPTFTPRRPAPPPRTWHPPAVAPPPRQPAMPPAPPAMTAAPPVPPATQPPPIPEPPAHAPAPEPPAAEPVSVASAAPESVAPEPADPEPSVLDSAASEPAPLGPAEPADDVSPPTASPEVAATSDPLLPLAPPPTPVPAKHPAPIPPGGELLVTAPVATPWRPGVVLGGHAADFGDDFGSVHRATVLAGPLAPPDQPTRRLIRYDLLAGAALVLALLALVPLLLLRGDPDELPSNARLPAAGESQGTEVTVELAEPTDLTDKVQLNWKATRELDFAVVVAAEGEKPQVLLVQRNHSMTVDVEPGLKYCFLVQATDGDKVFESEPKPLRGATCRK